MERDPSVESRLRMCCVLLAVSQQTDFHHRSVRSAGCEPHDLAQARPEFTTAGVTPVAGRTALPPSDWRPECVREGERKKKGSETSKGPQRFNFYLTIDRAQ